MASAISTASGVTNARQTTYRFERGTTAASGSRTPTNAVAGSDRSAHAVSAAPAGLLPAAVCHVPARRDEPGPHHREGPT